MPEASIVKKAPAVLAIVDTPVGLVIFIPLNVRFPPRAVDLAVVMVLSHTAISPDPGTTPPLQLPD
jgi:hypothetical protein